MSETSTVDFCLATYLIASGIAVAATIGQYIVKLLLIKFASHKRIEDCLWRLGSLLELRFGELKEGKEITIRARRFTATFTRTVEDKQGLIKKIANECLNKK
ncbi:C-type natriuretic protein [Cronobacter turicensis]|nr:C-type natriuretic protein [Cronobacter turicensis]